MNMNTTGAVAHVNKERPQAIPFVRDRGIENGQSRETDNKSSRRRRKTKRKHNTKCVGHHYTQTNTNNINKT